MRKIDHQILPRRSLREIAAEHSNWGLFIVFVALWQLLVGTGLVSNPAIPSPGAVLASLYRGLFGGQHLLIFATLETL